MYGLIYIYLFIYMLDILKILYSKFFIVYQEFKFTCPLLSMAHVLFGDKPWPG